MTASTRRKQTSRPRPARPRIAPRRARQTAPLPRAALLATAAGGAAAFVAAGVATTGRLSVAPLDRLTHRELTARWRDRVPPGAWWLGGRRPTRRQRLYEAMGGVAGQWPTAAAGALAAAVVAWRRNPRRALPLLAAAPLANLAHAALKYTIRRPRPLTAPLTGKRTPSFPSGHASRGAALAGALGYAAVREGVLPASVAIPLGLTTAVLGGASRVYVDRHWATDAVGGWGLGTAVAALCALWYDAT